MIDGQPRAIQLQGITHNTTKIGVQDGQSEDLVNLRFKDGAWRSTGDGKYIMDVGKYQQIFIHTNVYRHMLGVYNGQLWWFASAPEDKPNEFEPIEAVPICNVADGDVRITQTGHLITVIDSADDFDFFVFKTNENRYIEAVVDVNGKETDRTLYPFGEVHFNIVQNASEISDVTSLDSDVVVYEEAEIDLQLNEDEPGPFGEYVEANPKTATDLTRTAIEHATDKNLFTKPFLVCTAVELYDGSFVYASNPVFIFPDEALASQRLYIDEFGQKISFSPDRDNRIAYGIEREMNDTGVIVHAFSYSPIVQEGNRWHVFSELNYIHPEENLIMPTFAAGCNVPASPGTGVWKTLVIGSRLHVSLSDCNIIENNKDIFKSICIFVSQEAEYIDWDSAHSAYSMGANALPIFYKNREDKDISYDLLHSHLYLLKRYDKKTISELKGNGIVELSSKEDEGLLKSINNGTSNKYLTTESITRTSYIPRYSYNYNGRLLFADYKSKQFHGYPLNQFYKNNHSVKVVRGGSYLGLANLESNNDEYLQWPRTQYALAGSFSMQNHGNCAAYISTTIETDNGDQVATRYIPLADPDKFIEDLDALISFPDYRAKSINIRVATEAGRVEIIYEHTFELTPHPYLNLAYYINDSLKPIKLPKTELTLGGHVVGTEVTNMVHECFHPVEKNMQEDYPNAIKVSSTDNPMYFPVENTYPIGSSEIVAMCSNAIAVGTGQTGDAPLYVFCKDGIYALFVDSSGQMTYTNARVIARDVCNNPKSVTPIDAGVVFTTDRGLMMIAGNKVQEIGQPLEGDWCKFTREGDKDYSKHPAAAYEKVAELPADSITRDDFLTYLRDAIVSYNHNERELMVSNPQYRYTYILDRYGNWSRRDYRADEYVSNYPAVYRREGEDLYLVDEDSDEDNSIFALSNVIKMESIGFKELNRVVGRGYFETVADGYLRILVQGSYDGRKWVTLGHNTKRGKFRDMGCLVERTDCRFFRFVLAGKITKQSRFDYFEVSSKNSKLGAKIR